MLLVLRADPDQIADLAGDEGHQGVTAEQLGLLLSWRMRHDERTLTGHFLSPHNGLVVRRDPRR